jgi:hypothetical protein
MTGQRPKDEHVILTSLSLGASLLRDRSIVSILRVTPSTESKVGQIEKKDQQAIIDLLVNYGYKKN